MKKRRNISNKMYNLLRAEVERKYKKLKLLSRIRLEGRFIGETSSSDVPLDNDRTGYPSNTENDERESSVCEIDTNKADLITYNPDECDSVMSYNVGDVSNSTRSEKSSESESESESGTENELNFCDSDCSSCDEGNAILEPRQEQSASTSDIPSFVADSHTDIICEIRMWAVHNQVTVRALGSLLKILKSTFPNLPVDPKTVLRSGRRVEVEDMGKGTYYNFGLKESLTKIIASGQIKNKTIALNINIDTVPLFKSSGISFTPILCLVIDSALPPFISAIYCGSEKPNVAILLKDFAPELEELLNYGIELNETEYTVLVNCFVCDAPARSYLKCVKGHSGYYGCERCTQKGKSIGRLTFPHMNAPLRTDEDFACYTFQEHHHDVSPLTDIGILMVSQFNLDSMHLVYLGVMRKLLNKWIKSKRKFKFSYKSVSSLGELLLAAANIWPSDFNRKPRNFNELKRWKATELRQFLLYLGPVVLKNYLPRYVYDHFMLLHIGITIFVRKDLYVSLHNEAAGMLRDFVQKGTSPELYGNTFPIYNVHNLIHLADDVKRFGTLDDNSAFVFENELHRIKHLIRGRSKRLQQLVNQVTQIESIGTVPVPVQRDGVVESSIRSVGPTAGLRGGQSYSKYILHGKSISLRCGDNYAMLENSSIIKVINFFKNSAGEWVIGKRFVQYTDLYSTPFVSSRLGVFVGEKLSDLPRKYPAHVVRYKCVAVPLQKRGAFAFYPLVN